MTRLNGKQDLSQIQLQERAKRRRNSARGRKCAKGTIPQDYGPYKTAPQKGNGRFDKLRACLKALWERARKKG